jgi:hypothetical protein
VEGGARFFQRRKMKRCARGRRFLWAERELQRSSPLQVIPRRSFQFCTSVRFFHKKRRRGRLGTENANPTAREAAHASPLRDLSTAENVRSRKPSEFADSLRGV